MGSNFDSNSQQRISRFVQSSERQPRRLRNGPATWRQPPGQFDAMITATNNNPYTCVAISYDSAGNITKQPDWFQSDYCYEIRGCSQCIVGDVVRLSPIGNGNYSFVYNGKGRIVHAINSTHAAVSSGQIIEVATIVNVQPSGGENATIRYCSWRAEWVWHWVKCVPSPKTCCQNGISPEVTLTISGFTWDTYYHCNMPPDFLNNTFILDRTAKRQPLDCSGQPSIQANCSWSYFNDDVGTSTWLGGDYNYHSYNWKLGITFGIGVSDNGTSVVGGMTVGVWGCEDQLHNPGITRFFGLGFGYTVMLPVEQPGDYLNCSNLPDMTSNFGQFGPNVATATITWG